MQSRPSIVALSIAALIFGTAAFARIPESAVSRSDEVRFVNELDYLRSSSPIFPDDVFFQQRRAFYQGLESRGYLPAKALLMLLKLDGTGPDAMIRLDAIDDVVKVFRAGIAKGDLPATCALSALINRTGTIKDYGVSEQELATLAQKGAKAGHFACRLQVATLHRAERVAESRNMPLDFSIAADDQETSELEISSALAGYLRAVISRQLQLRAYPLDARSAAARMCWATFHDQILGQRNEAHMEYGFMRNDAESIDSERTRSEVLEALAPWEFVRGPMAGRKQLRPERCAEMDRALRRPADHRNAEHRR